MKKTTKTIEQFINGELSGKELIDFETRLKSDPKFRAEYELQIEVDDAISQKDIMELRNQLSVILNKQNKPQTKVSRITKGTFYRIAAAITVLAVVGSTLIYTQLNQSYSPEDIFTQNYEPYNGFIDRSASGDDQFDEIMVNAFINYENKDYKAALVGFKAILKTDEVNIPVNFYSGISNLELENFNEASKFFKLIIEHFDNYFVEQSNWYLGLCYLKMNKNENAIRKFKEISESDSYYKEKAIDILKKINS